MMSVEEFREFVITLCFVWMLLGMIVGSGLTLLWAKRDQDETDNQQTSNQQTFKENHQ